jgi:phage/plasmid replication protein, gene II/X family
MIGYDGSGLRPDLIAVLNYDRQIEWFKEKSIQVEGSYSDKIQLKPSMPSAEMISQAEKLNLQCAKTCIYFNGNPSKFLQGHNVFGPAVRSLAPVLTETIREFPGLLRPADADSKLYPAIHRNRVDITTSVNIGSHADVHQFLRLVSMTTRTRNEPAEFVKGTVYWQKRSALWTVKAYCKCCELKKEKHTPRGDKKLRDDLAQYTEGQVRIELTLRTLELKPLGTLHESLIWDYLNRVEGLDMKTRINRTSKTPILSRGVEFTLFQWKSGVDVSKALTHNTYYRHRRIIKNETGLDISLPYRPEIIEESEIDLEWLKSHEIKSCPEIFQGYIFKPEESPEWTVTGLK